MEQKCNLTPQLHKTFNNFIKKIYSRNPLHYIKDTALAFLILTIPSSCMVYCFNGTPIMRRVWIFFDIPTVFGCVKKKTRRPLKNRQSRTPTSHEHFKIITNRAQICKKASEAHLPYYARVIRSIF